MQFGQTRGSNAGDGALPASAGARPVSKRRNTDLDTVSREVASPSVSGLIHLLMIRLRTLLASSQFVQQAAGILWQGAPLRLSNLKR